MEFTASSTQTIQSLLISCAVKTISILWVGVWKPTLSSILASPPTMSCIIPSAANWPSCPKTRDSHSSGLWHLMFCLEHFFPLHLVYLLNSYTSLLHFYFLNEVVYGYFQVYYNPIPLFSLFHLISLFVFTEIQHTRFLVVLFAWWISH